VARGTWPEAEAFARAKSAEGFYRYRAQRAEETLCDLLEKFVIGSLLAHGPYALKRLHLAQCEFFDYGRQELYRVVKYVYRLTYGWAYRNAMSWNAADYKAIMEIYPCGIDDLLDMMSWSWPRCHIERAVTELRAAQRMATCGV